MAQARSADSPCCRAAQRSQARWRARTIGAAARAKLLRVAGGPSTRGRWPPGSPEGNLGATRTLQSWGMGARHRRASPASRPVPRAGPPGHGLAEMLRWGLHRTGPAMAVAPTLPPPRPAALPSRQALRAVPPPPAVTRLWSRPSSVGAGDPGNARRNPRANFAQPRRLRLARATTAPARWRPAPDDGGQPTRR